MRGRPAGPTVPPGTPGPATRTLAFGCFALGLEWLRVLTAQRPEVAVPALLLGESP